jgi:hypothetical protein
MKRDIADKLLQLAFLEGAITTRRGYENSVAKKSTQVPLPEEKQTTLLRRLEQALKKSRHAEQPLTVGGFLQQVRVERSIRSQEISSRVGLSSNIYRMLEHDRISPLKISADVWKRIRTLFNLSVDDLVEMVRRTHQLVFFRPSFRTTLARYDARKNKKMKSATLEKAAAEMFTRAKLKLPKEEEARLERLIGSIRGE